MTPGELGEYRRKRDFAATPEPAPKRRRGKARKPRFVVQEHSARRLHWDLRLEHDGVAASWAIPNGIPDDPADNRLAVHTEDHPLEYLEFEGEIPAGSYGAGTMTIWDRGTYELEKWEPAKVMVRFEGERLRGRYALFRTRSEKDWMIHRIDPPEVERDPFPEPFAPMRARDGALPRRRAGWAAELAWEGLRALAFCRPGRLRLHDAGGAEVRRLFPELSRLSRALGSRDAILDGVVTVLDDQGRADRERLQARLDPGSEGTVRRRAKSDPASFVIFDLPYLDLADLRGEPYERRRELLAGLELTGERWLTPANSTAPARELRDAAAKRGLPAIVVKRLDSPYEPGLTDAWVRVATRGGRRA